MSTTMYIPAESTMPSPKLNEVIVDVSIAADITKRISTMSTFLSHWDRVSLPVVAHRHYVHRVLSSCIIFVCFVGCASNY